MTDAPRDVGDRQLDLARQLVPMVLADAAAAGLAPVVELEPDGANGIGFMIFYAPGRGSGPTGNSPDLSGGAPELLAGLADAVQEVTMERDQYNCRVWPVCPVHGLGGHATVDAGRAIWWCNGGGGHLLAPIGELGRLPG